MVSVTPSPSAMPLTRCVLPLPSSPVRATTEPAVRKDAIRCPREKVSCGEFE
jgi:hypothetical protein